MLKFNGESITFNDNTSQTTGVEPIYKSGTGLKSIVAITNNTNISDSDYSIVNAGENNVISSGDYG